MILQSSVPQLDSASLLHLILESAVDVAIICTDLEDRVFTWNAGARRMFAYEEAEVIGRSAEILATLEDIAEGKLAIELQRVVTVGRLERERWQRRKDGSRFWARTLLMPLKKTGGVTQGYLRIMRDLTGQQRANEELRVSEARFRTVIENLPHKVWFQPVDGDVPFVNRGWREYTGFIAEEGPRWPELLHPDDFHAQMELRREALAAGLPYAFRTRVRRVDGAYRWQLARMVPLKNDGGQIFAWLGSWTDIEDIVAAETALGEALRRQELLTQEASHRVKNSLQLIANLLALQARGATDPDVQRALSEAGARITTTAQVHNRLWRQHDLTAVDLDSFLRDLCEDLGRNSAIGRLDYRGSTMMGSPDLALPLGLMVNELVTNAFKYACPAGDEVRVRLNLSVTGGIHLTVADDGPGLPAEFDIERADKSLGMRLVSVFVRQLNGSLKIEGTNPGTCFTIEAPLSDSG